MRPLRVPLGATLRLQKPELAGRCALRECSATRTIFSSGARNNPELAQRSHKNAGAQRHLVSFQQRPTGHMKKAPATYTKVRLYCQCCSGTNLSQHPDRYNKAGPCCLFWARLFSFIFHSGWKMRGGRARSCSRLPLRWYDDTDVAPCKGLNAINE